MDAAAAHGRLEVVQWLHNNRDEGCSTKAVDWAAEYGHLDVMKWLHENRSEGCSDSIMFHPVHKGYLEVVKWLVEHKLGMCSIDLMEAAIWEGHLEVACYLCENTKQRASTWVLVDARHSLLKAVLALMQNIYGNEETIDCHGHNSMYKCINKVLNELADEGLLLPSPIRCEVLSSLELFHASGFFSSVRIMLDKLLQRDVFTIVAHFFERRSEQEKHKYIAVAGKHHIIILVRWLIETGTPLELPTAIILATERSYAERVEVTWWLTECDRVALVFQALQKKWHKLLLWVLENTIFDEVSSLHAIHDAIKLAPVDTAEWLFENLSKVEVRSWCFPSEQEEQKKEMVSPTKRRRLG